MPNLKLSIVMAIMASMSTIMLGLSQGSAVLPGITLLAAVMSVLFTDALGWIQLNRFVANAAMLLAASFSLYGFLKSGSQQQLWAIAGLLTYVQAVLLFQRKNWRVYGQLTMFSLLQVVVALLLKDGFEISLLLSLYVLTALFGFVLYFVYREVGRVGTVSRRRFRLYWAGLGSASSESLNLPDLHVVDQGSALNRSIVTRRIVAPVLAMVAATAVFAMAFFFTTPRTGGASWQSGLRGRGLVGFSPVVTFDEMGQLLQSDQRVMRVAFSSVRTGEPYTVIGEPYLCGVVLTRYSNGLWQQASRSNQIPLAALGKPPGVRDLVRQNVLLEPTGSNRLFSVFPAYADAQTPANLCVDRRSRHLYRSGVTRGNLRSECRYDLVTTAFRFGSQLEVVPHRNRLSTETDRNLMNQSHHAMRDIRWPERLPQLINLAEQIVKDKAPDGDSYELARAMEKYFLEPGRFHYTLNMNDIKAKRQPSVDPIEDFVSNHRSGHCEYFASALALMLRSQGIPARLVIGYRPSEFNYVGHYYIVRQRDAHAWVEAYLTLEEIGDEMLWTEEQHAGGGWLRLDPTPAQERDSELGQRDLLDRASESLDYAQWVWNDYVLRFAGGQQGISGSPWGFVGDFSLAESISADARQRFAKLIGATGLGDLLRGNFSWRGGLAVMFACGAAYLIYRLVRTSLGTLRQRVQGLLALPRRRRRVNVPFYHELESALARIGLRREATQTQRQFARAAAQRLACSPQYATAADVPSQIVDLFYLVRFGHRTPSAQQEVQIRESLRLLQDVLANYRTDRDLLGCQRLACELPRLARPIFTTCQLTDYEDRTCRIPRIGKKHAVSVVDR